MPKDISSKWDPVSGDVPLENTFKDHPGLEVSNKAVPETPGEKATNSATALSYNKGQPFGKGGSGYTKGS